MHTGKRHALSLAPKHSTILHHTRESSALKLPVARVVAVVTHCVTDKAKKLVNITFSRRICLDASV